ncbi:rhamnosyltransferase WsaF family glycosyltransferase [Nitrosospira multiformis]|uniref:rhamnosyltransferase WsaF family glycosyltransferase n=1 Tax=Nitrosospira multiformis TaxID=1231 RepID=UPI0015E69134|nr:rhamnan synthesis F family protein [Nitrosospira multiformis]
MNTPAITRAETPHLAPPTDDYCLVVPLDYSIGNWDAVPSIAVICHMYYVELAEEIKRYLTKIPFPFDLFITTDSQEKQLAIESHFNDWNKGAIEIRIAPNRGRDIAPKLIACRDVYDRYEFILHIHTKKSPHYELLRGWRSYLFETLLGSKKIVESIFEAFRSDSKLGMVAPQHFEPVRHSIGWGWNFKNAERFARRLDIKISLNGRLDFPSGSMFWARSAALKPLLDCNLCLDEFPSEADQEDGTLGHIIERLYFFVSERAGYRWIKIAQPSLMGRTEGMKNVQNQKELLNFIKDTQYGLLKSRKSQVLKLPFITSRNSSLDRKRDLELLAYERSSYKFIDFPQFQRQLKLHMEKKDSLIDFDDDFYLNVNLDVAATVANGVFSCGFIHYCLRGQDEGRIWSDNQLKRRFSISPNFPEGFTAPVYIRPLPQSNIDLSHLPRSQGTFLLIFFSHLQDDLFFAGYTAFFQDFKPLFGKFSKVVLSVESDRFDPRLAKRYSDQIEVVQAKELERLKYQPDLIIAFNSQLFIKALQICNNPNRTVYYCQDFESGFFPYGAEYVEAERAIASSHNIIVSTELLKSFFISRQLLDKQRVFTTSPKIEPLDVRAEKTKRLFFYFRPESFHRRNLPQTIMEAVENFCRKHIGYEIFLVGSVDTRYSYKINGTPVYVINKLPRKDYIQLISSCDLVVSMIYSAHPGVIAFQSAASGIPTITNVFENRDASLLKQISENILPYDPIREDLLEIIEVALTMPKGKKSFNDRLYSGHNTQSLSDFIDIVLSSESAVTNGSGKINQNWVESNLTQRKFVKQR